MSLGLTARRLQGWLRRGKGTLGNSYRSRLFCHAASNEMITTFPDELLLALFGEFHLTTIIIASGVCRKWRSLVLLADIHPIRRSLLGIYQQIIKETWFLQSRPWVLNNLKPFNRMEYVTALLAQHNYLPEAFRIWVLEWPAKAAFGGIWPGLPNEIGDIAGPEIRYSRRTWNLLNPSKPIVWTINHINEDDQFVACRQS
ncbi:hypothetical protein ONZ45_g18749 [Pleurotus djamor]|nr:hypothetical protein ONZ45_g18749 [Pleurotus djamor]